MFFQKCFVANQQFLNQVNMFGIEQFESMGMYHTIRRTLKRKGESKKFIDENISPKVNLQKQALDKRYPYMVNGQSFSPIFHTTSKIIDRTVKAKLNPEEVVDELIKLGGNIFDKNSFSQKSFLSNRECNLNYILPLKPLSKPLEKQEFVNYAYLAATYPVLLPKIIRNIAAATDIHEEKLEDFFDKYVDISGDYGAVPYLKTSIEDWRQFDKLAPAYAPDFEGPYSSWLQKYKFNIKKQDLL